MTDNDNDQFREVTSSEYPASSEHLELISNPLSGGGGEGLVDGNLEDKEGRMGFP